MIALAWICAGTFFALWLIEHVGGRQARDDLRRRAEGHRIATEVYKALLNHELNKKRGAFNASQAVRRG